MNKEEVIWTTTPSQVTNLPTLLLGLVVGIILTVAGVLFLLPVTGPIFFGILAAVWLVCLIPWLWKFIVIKNYRYQLTKERFKVVTGVFSRNTEVLELYRVKDMSIDRPFIFRVFGLSNLTLTTSDRSTPIVTMRAIRQGDDVSNLVRERVEVLRDKKRVREVDFEGDSDFDE